MIELFLEFVSVCIFVEGNDKYNVIYIRITKVQNKGGIFNFLMVFTRYKFNGFNVYNQYKLKRNTHTLSHPIWKIGKLMVKMQKKNYLSRKWEIRWICVPFAFLYWYVNLSTLSFHVANVQSDWHVLKLTLKKLGKIVGNARL